MKTTHVLVVAGMATAAVLMLSPSEQAQPVELVSVPSFQTRTICARGEAVSCDAVDPSAKRGAKYKRIRTHANDCVTYRVWSDGGTESLGVESRPYGKHLDVVPGSCVPASAPAPEDGGLALAEQACACRKATGRCLFLTDGGAEEAPKGRTLGPGYPPYETWTGEGCQPKACVEMSGESSWPANCPR